MNLEGLELHWVWLIAAAVLASAEIVAPGVFLIFLAGAAALTAIAAALGVPLAFQLGLFPLFALGSVWFGKRHYHRNPVPSSDPLLNDRLARHVGQTVVVVEAIEGGSGRVKLGDSVWNARGPDAAPGTRMRITGAEGTCLRVEPASNPQVPD
ncbi:MAG TPA: NfeD family protein [Allosphingosinicella sp.]|uniref:NfeD family protein n=1 Tax=Allosphingosinicella sp. TaxID=2823234 RepID=UPI002ED79206